MIRALLVAVLLAAVVSLVLITITVAEPPYIDDIAVPAAADRTPCPWDSVLTDGSFGRISWFQDGVCYVRPGP